MTTSSSTTRPIEFYGTSSPNVFKVQILLRELNIPFNYHPLSIRNGDQYSPEFQKINPNAKFPAIIDYTEDGTPIKVFESGNILLYLAEKYQKLIPKDILGRTEVLNWLFFQMANLGPIFGNYYHFIVYASEKHPYSIQRYHSELKRLLHVLESQLATRQFIAGDEYSIADIALYPWTSIFKFADLTNEDFPNLSAYNARIAERPAVKQFEKEVAEERQKNPSKSPTEEERKWMFNREHNKSTN